jgi:hypothetical protein
MATPGDKILFISLFIATLISFLFVKDLFPAGGLVKVTVAGNTAYLLPIEENRTVKVTGPIGDNVIEIKNGRVHIKEASCPNKLCVYQGWIDRGSIICLPNRVVVSIGGVNQRQSSSGPYDAITK